MIFFETFLFRLKKSNIDISQTGTILENHSKSFATQKYLKFRIKRNSIKRAGAVHWGVGLLQRSPDYQPSVISLQLLEKHQRPKIENPKSKIFSFPNKITSSFFSFKILKSEICVFIV